MEERLLAGLTARRWPCLKRVVGVTSPLTLIDRSLGVKDSRRNGSRSWSLNSAPLTDIEPLLRDKEAMKPFSTLLSLAALAATSAFAQMSQPMVDENTTKISEHVWAIMGFPNIAIVVGRHATLVVDTGLGPKNGATAATAARVAAKLAPNNPKLFLTTTHFHPEHAAGEPGFPPGTILIRDAVQQQEMEKPGEK
jgi:hypothetical protein